MAVIVSFKGIAKDIATFQRAYHFDNSLRVIASYATTIITFITAFIIFGHHEMSDT